MVSLERETPWSKTGDGPLTFPWDAELGDPQARFYRDGDNWSLEGIKAKHRTYCNGKECVNKKVTLAKGDILKASVTWLVVVEVG